MIARETTRCHRHSPTSREDGTNSGRCSLDVASSRCYRQVLLQSRQYGRAQWEYSFVVQETISIEAGLYLYYQCLSHIWIDFHQMISNIFPHYYIDLSIEGKSPLKSINFVKFSNLRDTWHFHSGIWKLVDLIGDLLTFKKLKHILSRFYS